MWIRSSSIAPSSRSIRGWPLRGACCLVRHGPPRCSRATTTWPPARSWPPTKWGSRFRAACRSRASTTAMSRRSSGRDSLPCTSQRTKWHTRQRTCSSARWATKRRPGAWRFPTVWCAANRRGPVRPTRPPNQTRAADRLLQAEPVREADAHVASVHVLEARESRVLDAGVLQRYPLPAHFAAEAVGVIEFEVIEETIAVELGVHVLHIPGADIPRVREAIDAVQLERRARHHDVGITRGREHHFVTHECLDLERRGCDRPEPSTDAHIDALPGFDVLVVAIFEEHRGDIIAAEVHIHLRQESATFAGICRLCCRGS